MYSWEIDRFLQDRDFTVTKEDMDFIRKSSQILRVIYCGTDGRKSKYSICTSDNFNWVVWMWNKEDVE